MITNSNNTIRARACAVGLALALATSGAQGATLSKFTGGDPGEGLDLSGNFVYALDFRLSGGTPNVVQDATFLPASIGSTPAGVTGLSYLLPFNALTAIGLPGPFTFGASANDDALEAVMDSGGFADLGANKFTVSLAVTPGEEYKLQLLMFGNAGAHRPGNYTIDGAGTTFIDIPTDASAYPVSSYVVTETFIAPSSVENIVIAWTGGASNNPIILGLTLEIPEPSTVALLTLSGLLLVMRRRK